MANPIPPIQPAPIRAAPLDAQGLPSKIWVNWFNQIQRTSQVVATNTGGVAGLTSQVAALLSDVTGIDATLATHTTELAALLTDVTGIDATLLAQAASILAAALFATALPPDRQYLPELEELKKSLAALAFERQYSPELEDLKASLAPLPSDRPYSTELEELKAYVQVCASGFVDRFVEELTDLRALVASFDVDAGSLANAVSAGVLSTSLQIAANLSDLANAATARTNLGLGTAATTAASAYDVSGAAAAVLATSCQKANNLSDVTAATARTNLGLGAAALLATPIPIASGGTGAATFLAAGLPALSAANAFGALNTFTRAIVGGTVDNSSGYALQVEGATAQLLIVTNSSTGLAALVIENDTTAFVEVKAYGSAIGGTLFGFALANLSTLFAGGGSTALAVGTSVSAPLILGTNNVERARFVGAGDLLIGTTTDNTTDKLQVAGHIGIVTVGNGLKIKEGSNARSGTGTLVAGTVTIANTSITANTRVQITGNGGGVAANFGALYRSAIVAGTSFTVKSTNALDTATFDWLLIEAL